MSRIRFFTSLREAVALTGVCVISIVVALLAGLVVPRAYATLSANAPDPVPTVSLFNTDAAHVEPFATTALASLYEVWRVQAAYSRNHVPVWPAPRLQVADLTLTASCGHEAFDPQKLAIAECIQPNIVYISGPVMRSLATRVGLGAVAALIAVNFTLDTMRIDENSRFGACAAGVWMGVLHFWDKTDDAVVAAFFVPLDENGNDGQAAREGYRSRSLDTCLRQYLS